MIHNILLDITLLLCIHLQAARILVVLLCKHEFDVRYQKPEDKLYIAQLYLPVIGQVHNIILILMLFLFC